MSKWQILYILELLAHKHKLAIEAIKALNKAKQPKTEAQN